jgi:hypothetical protein
MRTFLWLICCLLTTAGLHAQTAGERATITGLVTDAISGQPIELVTIYIAGTNTAVETAANGRYQLFIPAEKSVEIVFSRIGYKDTRTTVAPMPARTSRQIDVALANADSEVEVIVRESKIDDSGLLREDVNQLKLLPSTTGNLESALPHLALGVSSGSGGELTSQYNVRGGNYDENLVYVNDFEIYRPQLVRAGQQEGLSFPNIDLMQSLLFSSGGFEARYGDKLSSVLDIKYKRPDSLRASVGMSFLGGSAHIEGSFRPGKDSYRRLRYLVGARYKTNRYLLGSLDVTGEYLPNFSDIQAYITYDLNPNWQLGLLANYNRSVYQFRPNQRTTGFGLINFALQLFSVFEGQEYNDFTTQMGGLSLTYLPDRSRNPMFLKFMLSTFSSDENERIDIAGRYSLRQIDNNLGSDNFGDVLSELGTGKQQQYVRNFLDIRVYNAEHKGAIEFQTDSGDDSRRSSSHFLQWNVKGQYEDINDYLNEWERLDSAGYSLPYDTSQVLLYSVLKTRNQLSSARLSASVQDTYTWRQDDKGELRLSAGLRTSYWSLNQELLIAPRAQLLYKPLAGKRDLSYRLAAGYYYQPPFYRELRAPDGLVNTDVRAQKSFHVVGGMTLDFYMGKNNPKKFRFITEAYYKALWDLISYEIENVRIQYSGQNDAAGYATGIDMRLNGEFVPGAESWINLSLLRTRERLTGVQHFVRERGSAEGMPVADVPRPSDRLMQLSVFFQDYLRNNDRFKTHVNLTVGTGLPFGLLDNNFVYRNPYRFSPYHRIDIGFSFLLWDALRPRAKPNHLLDFSRTTWLSLEVFNLMQVQNQAGNTWIKTVFNQQYAVPNYLTSRRINLRMRMEF